ncbi:LysR family transcriptional regulator [Alcaligenaceae bacterium SJ-26]|nr:LysR family transcriptional regulator [Alcaligenaceae bacterium SJ-26]
MPTSDLLNAWPDLNDLKFAVAVADAGGFSAAARLLGVPKSRLSQHISQLETELGMRLFQRTTRHFSITEAGDIFLANCRSVLQQAQNARDIMTALQREPQGFVRLSCPPSFAQSIMPRLLVEFMEQYPRIQVHLRVKSGHFDLLSEGFDVSIRVRSELDTDHDLVARIFGISQPMLIASPKLWDTHARIDCPEQLANLPFLSMVDAEERRNIPLSRQTDTVNINVSPRLVCSDFHILQEAVCAGLGAAVLPDIIAIPLLKAGHVEPLLPEWSYPRNIGHFVYPTRRGLMPGVRALVNFLAQRLVHLPF